MTSQATTPRRRASRTGGFTLIEMQIALALSTIVAGMAVVSVQGVISSARGDSAMMQTASLLRLGRDTAIAQRRTITLQFEAPNRLQLVRTDVPAGVTVIADVVLENGAQLLRDAAIPDTPDGFGADSATDFDGAGAVRFEPDGMLSDGTGVPVNGTVFTAVPGQPISTRAVTVTGSSGRAQCYRWTGARWEAQ